MMNDEFQLAPLPPDADTAEMLEAIGPLEGRPAGLLPKHVVVASMRIEDSHEDLRIGIASDEVVGTYSVTADDLLRQAPENVPHCIGMLRHDDRLALVLDLSRLLEVYPGPSI